MPRALKRLAEIYAALAVIGCLAGFVIAPHNGRGPLQGIDDRGRNLVLAHWTPSMLRVAHYIENFGKVELLIPLVAVITVALWVWGFRVRSFAPALSLVGTGLLVEPLKHLIRRPGPAALDTAHLAWPSGHTAGITAVLVPLATLAWVTRRWWWPSVVAAVFTLAVGVSMVIVQGHWITDVIAGAVLAGAWGVAVVVVLPDRLDTGAQVPDRVGAMNDDLHSPPPRSWHEPAESTH